MSRATELADLHEDIGKDIGAGFEVLPTVETCKQTATLLRQQEAALKQCVAALNHIEARLDAADQNRIYAAVTAAEECLK